jgi:hypothetical protein
MMTPMAHRPTRHRPSVARRVVLAMALSLGLSAAMPHTASASNDEDEEHYDARVQGYTPTVEAKSSGVGLVWALLFLLGGGCVGIMFMNPKRSHLD